MYKIALGDGLKQEVLSVATASPEVDRTCFYKLSIITESDTFEIEHVETVSDIRDFNSKITNSIKIVFSMFLGDYIKNIKPFKNKLKATLTHDTPGGIHIDEYKLIIALEDANVSADVFKDSKDNLNRTLTTLHAECVDESIIFLKQQNKGMILKDSTTETALVSVLDDVLNKVTGKFGIAKAPIHIIEPDNKRVYKHIVIPSTLKALETPIYLQEKLGGVYNGSINTFLYRENNILKTYVFPLYRSNLLNTREHKLYIISAFDLLTIGGNTTYSVDSNNDVRVIVKQKNKMDDDNIELLGKGGSVKGIDANTVRGRPVSISKDKVSIKRKNMFRNMKEEVADDLSDIINVAPTDNFYEPRSRVLKNKLAKVIVEWDHSNARLIYPYMPVIFLEENNEGNVVVREGMVNGIDIFTNNSNKIETCSLSLLLTPRETSASKPVKLF